MAAGAVAGQVVHIVPAVHAGAAAQLATRGAIGTLYDAFRLLKLGFILIAVQFVIHGGHHRLPQSTGGVTGQTVVDLLGLVIAVPYAGHKVRRAAHKPAVLIVRSGTGLAEALNTGQLVRSTGAGGHNRLQQLVHHPGGILRQRGLFGLFRLLLQHHIALHILDLRVAVRLVVVAAVAKSGVGRGHLQHGYTVGHTAGSHRRVVAVLHAVQRADVEPIADKVQRVIHRPGVTDHIQRAGGDGVFRLGKTVLQGNGAAAVTAALVGGPGFAVHNL